MRSPRSEPPSPRPPGSFQARAVQHLGQRVGRALAWAKEMAPGLASVVVAGGVAANKAVRAELNAVRNRLHYIHVPPPTPDPFIPHPCSCSCLPLPRT
jgi:hypothetical protein